MSRQDEKLQLRLFSPQVTPRRNRGLDDVNDQRPRSMPLSAGKDIEQAASPPSTPVRRNENPTSDHNLDNNFTMSPDNKLSPENKRYFTMDVKSLPNYPYSTPRSTTGPAIVMDIPGSPLISWRKPEAGPAWKEIQNLRADVWDLRSQIQQMRASLREKQDVKAAADDRLFRRITYMTAQGLSLTDPSSRLSSEQKSLAQLMHDCQEARNEYGPLEDDCTKLEDRVSQQEFKLARLEDRFFEQLNSGQQTARLSQTSLPDDESVSASEASDGDEFEASEFHPLVTEYLSKLGDLDLMKERLDEFRDERAALEAEKLSRQRFKRALDPDDQNWLNEAEAEYHEITSTIHSLEHESENLKQICLSMNLVDEDGEPTTFQHQEASSFAGEKDMGSQDRESEYVKYPLLLPYPPRKKRENNSRYERSPDIESDTTTTRINEWILDKLRISPLDVNLLARTFESIYGRTPKDWQIHVLKVWYKDDTTLSKATNNHERPMSPASHNSSMNTRHPEASHSSEVSQEHMRGSVHVLLAPTNRPPSILSDGTERLFALSKFNISSGLEAKPLQPHRTRS